MRGMRVLALLATLIVPGVALGADVQFCVEIMTEYTDSSWTAGAAEPEWELNVFPTPLSAVTEDNWKYKILERPPHGAKYEITRNGYLVNQGYLGDGFDANKPAGCSDNLQNVNLNASWYMYVYSEGVVQSNFVYSYDHTKTRRMQSLYLGFNPPAGRSTTKFPGSSDGVTSDVMTGYIAAAYALYRHAGGETNNKYYIYRCACSTQCFNIAPYSIDCSCAWNGPDCRTRGNKSNQFWNGWRVSSMSPAGINRKFTLIHELGHAIATNITNGAANSGDCSEDDGSAVCSTGDPTDHALWSRETQRCALSEGFADFYSADVWNSHSAKDCAFKYWTTNTNTNSYGNALGGAAFDCAGDDGADTGSSRDDFTNGQVPAVVPYLDQCIGPYSGRATEMDYLRVLWNVHTDGSTPPSFTDIARWIRDSAPFTQNDVYDRLEELADPRNDSLEANWDANKGPHHVNNPAP